MLHRLREGQTEIESAVETEFDEILESLAAEGITPVPSASHPHLDLQVVPTSGAGGNPPLAGCPPRSRAASLGATARDLWAVRRQLRLGLGLMVLQQVIGINTIMYYSGDILKQAHVGNDQTVIWLTAPVASGQLVGCLIGMQLIDRYGRRPLVLSSLVGVIVALSLEGGVFAVDQWYCHIDIDAGSGPEPLDEKHGGICAATGWMSLVRRTPGLESRRIWLYSSPPAGSHWPVSPRTRIWLYSSPPAGSHWPVSPRTRIWLYSSPSAGSHWPVSPLDSNLAVSSPPLAAAPRVLGGRAGLGARAWLTSW